MLKAHQKSLLSSNVVPFAGTWSPTIICLSAVVYPDAKDKERGLTWCFFSCHADKDHQPLQTELLKMKTVKSLLSLSSFKCEWGVWTYLSSPLCNCNSQVADVQSCIPRYCTGNGGYSIHRDRRTSSSASSREEVSFLGKWESHQGLEPSHLESLGGKLWGQEGSSVQTESTQWTNVHLITWWEEAVERVEGVGIWLQFPTQIWVPTNWTQLLIAIFRV